jgi:hypothetical protein
MFPTHHATPRITRTDTVAVVIRAGKIVVVSVGLPVYRSRKSEAELAAHRLHTFVEMETMDHLR